MIRILVAAHRQCSIPSEDIYQPIQVGAAGGHLDNDWMRDDTGDHISWKNGTYCELTGLYWAWKNLNADVMGLCHYRRYMGNRKFWLRKTERILSGAEMERLLVGRDLILPRKRHYWIETRGSQYAHAHHAEDLRCTEQVIAERCPEYLLSWKWMLGRLSGHICNMFIMRRELMDAYCTWLFDILFEVEKRLDISGYSDQDKRVFGYLGERLLDVWVHHNQLRYVETPMIYLERPHWIRKGMRLIGRKLKGSRKSAIRGDGGRR